MQFAYGMLAHTPPWVFVLLAYLVWLGIKAMQPQTTTIWRALIVPAVFIVWGVSRIGLRQDAIWPPIAWIAAALALLPLGVLTPRPFELDHATGQITRSGSVFPLIRNLVVFALQYSVAVISAVDVHDRLLAAIIGRAISGATAGYFIGSTIALLRAYWHKRRQAAAS
ncbi:hypothetical protein UP10_26865 [Bradyrhizobium sp. LTSPM299]|uniref:DUF6622 family protein n=1 Tax=Bradyrhizobium sp. LTSPM299 TaxID=1619233 RepID=UPI0005C81AF1|nr:DUF6622 family protein [Bradyrhizobium sp. LTSPM299]KJC57821.1 hypothetical protein UP10_26865 [Bradyrhizobium sp. LTSPM299]